MDEGKALEQRARGDRAKRERESQFIDGFISQAKSACHKLWADSKPEETQEREWLYFRLQALEDIEQCYTKTINDGEFAQAELVRAQQEKTNAS